MVDPITLEMDEFARMDGSARGIVVDNARESIWVDLTRASS